MMYSPLTKTIAVGLVICASGCASLSRTERATLYELKSYGISATELRVKHPVAAGGLNVLPGFGNFYLAVGTDESEQWLYGFVNLLLWPLSAVWGIPEAAIDANTINKKETVNYYTFDRIGKQKLQDLRETNSTARPEPGTPSRETPENGDRKATKQASPAPEPPKAPDADDTKVPPLAPAKTRPLDDLMR